MKKAIACLFSAYFAVTTSLLAQSIDPIEPIPDHVMVSPNAGWLEVPESEDPSLGNRVLYWIPNRLLDFWDIVRIDGGIGPSLGGAVRLTRYVQIASRKFAPASLRIGAMGRRLPIMLESSDEQGIEPFAYSPSTQRDICTYEVGLGLEFIIAGAYLGICPEEFFDFIGGIFLLDFEHDDLD